TTRRRNSGLSLTLLDQHHCRRTDDRPGHRGDPKFGSHANKNARSSRRKARHGCGIGLSGDQHAAKPAAAKPGAAELHGRSAPLSWKIDLDAARLSGQPARRLGSSGRRAVSLMLVFRRVFVPAGFIIIIIAPIDDVAIARFETAASEVQAAM